MKVRVFKADVVIVGAGSAGLRAAIAAAETDATQTVALVSKVYPMRSHTCAAEGGAAGVVDAKDSLDAHFYDTVAGGDWLCEQDVGELTRIEHWGCPWSRRDDGRVNVRPFGGMKNERTWFAADRTGMHLLHTLFQTSLKYPAIRRFDEYFLIDLVVVDGHARGVLVVEIASGEYTLIEAGAVILATGGATRVFRENTNGGIVTGDGMAVAYRHGVALRDMEFVQYHPTCMPGTGLLFTEACRGEGGLLTNRDGYRCLQDYGLGPVQDAPRNKFMELGPRDRLSQAFWHEMQKGRTLDGPYGPVVHLDLRHLGAARLAERLPQICELAREFMGIDPVTAPIPVRPAVHYTMGGINADADGATTLPGLFAIGECSSVGIHGANRLGSNSLSELLVFGRRAGEAATRLAREATPASAEALLAQAEAAAHPSRALLREDDRERIADLRRAMAQTMEDGCGIYRTEASMQATCDTLAELRERFRRVTVTDRSSVWNSEWFTAIELGYQLEVAEAMAHSALNRRESRGAHQRLDFEARDDAQFLRHSLAYRQADGAPQIRYQDVNITRLPPAVRAYGAAGLAAEAGEKA